MKRGFGKINGLKHKKADSESGFVGYVVIAVLVLTLALIWYLIFSGKGANAIEYIKNMFRNLFGG